MLRFVSRASIDTGSRRASTGTLAARFVPRRRLARSDWLILFAAFDGAPDGLDPVRIQAGLFLFSRCPATPSRSKYAFEPGIYGPVSDELDGDLDHLAHDRLLEPAPVRGASWSLYKPIDTTFERATRILRQAEDENLLDATRQLREIKRYVSSVGFGELLQHVYTEYPDFAVNSVFRTTA